MPNLKDHGSPISIAWIWGAVLAAMVLAAMVLAAGQPAVAADDDFTPFFGRYVGEAVVETSSGNEKREIEVVIEKKGEGFSLRWTTISEKPSGKTKEASYYAAFKRKEPHVYRTTEKDIDFGDATGATYARIEGKKMTVIAFLITVGGRHEVQRYERELVPGGMKLTFTRTIDNVELKSVEAMLKKM